LGLGTWDQVRLDNNYRWHEKIPKLGNVGFAKYTTKTAKYTTQILTRLKNSNT